MLKVGDELLCKKMILDITINLKKNEYYTIIDIINNLVYVNYDWYNSNPESFWYIWDYFYTTKEVRKMKLERLKQC